jgi:hypothetical protein
MEEIQRLLKIYKVRERGAYDHDKVTRRESCSKALLNLKVVIEWESSVQ